MSNSANVKRFPALLPLDHPALWAHENSRILARIANSSLLKVAVEIALKYPISINSSPSRPVQEFELSPFTSYFFSVKTSQDVLFHFTWNKLNGHLGSLGIEAIKPGSTVSKTVLASNKSRVYW